MPDATARRDCSDAGEDATPPVARQVARGRDPASPGHHPQMRAVWGRPRLAPSCRPGAVRCEPARNAVEWMERSHGPHLYRHGPHATPPPGVDACRHLGGVPAGAPPGVDREKRSPPARTVPPQSRRGGPAQRPHPSPHVANLAGAMAPITGPWCVNAVDRRTNHSDRADHAAGSGKPPRSASSTVQLSAARAAARASSVEAARLAWPVARRSASASSSSGIASRGRPAFHNAFPRCCSAKSRR